MSGSAAGSGTAAGSGRAEGRGRAMGAGGQRELECGDSRGGKGSVSKS